MTAKTGQGRPISSRTHLACEVLEKYGPMPTVKVTKAMGLTTCSATNYLNRAAIFGFVTADRSTFPTIYTVVANWREMIDMHKCEGPALPRSAPRRRVASVWELGAQT